MPASDEKPMDAMVNRFLGWKLPQTFGPDCYVNFDKAKALANHGWPIGTNLLTADEARAMLEHVVADELMSAAMLTWNALEAAANDVANAEAKNIIREFLVRSWHTQVLPKINRALGVMGTPATKEDFPYDRTFQAIAAATRSTRPGAGIGISVKAFIEAWNAHPSAGVTGTWHCGRGCEHPDVCMVIKAAAGGACEGSHGVKGDAS